MKFYLTPYLQFHVEGDNIYNNALGDCPIPKF